ncbi:hypothetical protein KGM_202267 [Danaus plexippus plexippus]|uniref:Uncharacterized protein n=1 Tax=Danaus plexippus plexippus TaxID=278856 RepID=A0A212ETS6_DANPL|nr:hypothetical protein KGM_202267 [Danaus plexippus plexippus]
MSAHEMLNARRGDPNDYTFAYDASYNSTAVGVKRCQAADGVTQDVSASAHRETGPYR